MNISTSKYIMVFQWWTINIISTSQLFLNNEYKLITIVHDQWNYFIFIILSQSFMNNVQYQFITVFYEQWVSISAHHNLSWTMNISSLQYCSSTMNISSSQLFMNNEYQLITVLDEEYYHMQFITILHVNLLVIHVYVFWMVDTGVIIFRMFTFVM